MNAARDARRRSCRRWVRRSGLARGLSKLWGFIGVHGLFVRGLPTASRRCRRAPVGLAVGSNPISMRVPAKPTATTGRNACFLSFSLLLFPFSFCLLILFFCKKKEPTPVVAVGKWVKPNIHAGFQPTASRRQAPNFRREASPCRRKGRKGNTPHVGLHITHPL